MRNKVAVTLKKVKELRNKKKLGEMEIFLKEAIITTDGQGQDRASGSDGTSIPNEKCKLCKTLELENQTLKKKLDRERETNKTMTEQVAILKEDRDKLSSLAESSKEVIALRRRVKELQCQMEKEMINNLNELDKLQKTKLYKNNQSVKKSLTEVSEQNNQLLKQAEGDKEEKKVLSKEVNSLKRKIKSEQSLKSKYKKKFAEQRTINSDLNKMLESDNLTLRNDGSSHRYSDNVRRTYYALQGEANVAATNCSKVVEIVSKHLFQTEFQESLPSASTSLNFSNEAHIIAKQQVASEILSNHHFTFACDATSRQKAHYLEQHIVLSNGKTLSLGFSEIASDDSETLLEKCVGIFNDICKVYCLDETAVEEDKLQKEIIRKLQCLLSDRAAVMKAFDSKMLKYKVDLLGGEDCTIHFLFCNAHFLLALSTAAEEAIRSIEESYQEEGGKLGRDGKSSFARFSAASECAAIRLVRMASEVLGPRGDERNGCREEWLAFCSAHNKRSLFSSYRSNRFNNLFQNASALLFHKDDIELFLNEYASNSNLKLQSIVSDMSDKRVLNSVAALCFFHTHLTEPYWQLMNSSKSYADFPPYVKEMKSTLLCWASQDFDLNCCDSSSALSEFFVFDLQSNFSKFFNSEFFDSMLFFPVLQKIALNMEAALERQLADFLEGGIFGAELDKNLIEILKTCPLTNLTGERLFGDFDFDMNKRRNTSLHVRSTTNMWKHNGTANWLKKQTNSTSKKIVKKAIKYGSEWRKKYQNERASVKQKIKAKIMQNKRERELKDIKMKERRLKALDAIIGELYVIDSKEELDQVYNGPNAVERLKDQIRFRSLVRGEKITLKGNKKMLYERLLRHITESEDLE